VAQEGFERWDTLERRLQRLEAAVSQHDSAAVRSLIAVGPQSIPVP
jgi:hypothetical protein